MVLGMAPESLVFLGGLITASVGLLAIWANIQIANVNRQLAERATKHAENATRLAVTEEHSANCARELQEVRERLLTAEQRHIQSERHGIALAEIAAGIQALLLRHGTGPAGAAGAAGAEGRPGVQGERGEPGTSTGPTAMSGFTY